MSGIPFFYLTVLVWLSITRFIDNWPVSLATVFQCPRVMNNVPMGAVQRQTVSSVSRIMHEIASSQKALVQLPPWFAPILRCHPPLINPSRPLRWQSVWLPFRGLLGRSCWGGEGGGGRGSRREGRREPAAATAGGESGRARWSFLVLLLLFRSFLVASALVSPPSEVLTSVAFRWHRKTWLSEVKTTSSIRPPTGGE